MFVAGWGEEMMESGKRIMVLRCILYNKCCFVGSMDQRKGTSSGTSWNIPQRIFSGSFFGKCPELRSFARGQEGSWRRVDIFGEVFYLP